MQIKVDKQALSPLLDQAAAVAPAKAQAQFLRVIWLSAQDGHLRVEANDRMQEYTGTCPCGVQQPGVVGADRRLADLVRKLPAGDIELKLGDQTLTVQSGKRRYQMPVYDSSWYAPCSRPDSEFSPIHSRLLQEVFVRPAFSASPDPTDEALHSVHLDLAGGESQDMLRSWAVDGHMAAYQLADMAQASEVREQLEPLIQGAPLALAKTHVQALGKVIRDYSWCELALDDKRIYVSCGPHTFSYPLQTYPAPDFNRILEAAKREEDIIAARQPLLQALDRMSVFAADKRTQTVSLHFNQHFNPQGGAEALELELRLNSQESAQAREYVPLFKTVRKSFAQALDGLTLPVAGWQQVLRQMDADADQVEISFSDLQGPVCHWVMGGSGIGSSVFTTILMPVVTEQETYYDEELVA
ncbi:MAG: hypothetical protein ACOC43_09990 [Desulfohalobiaceae bacterium]